MSEEENKSWIYAGGIPYELTEGDVICVFSQYGEIFEISLSRDKETGKSRGFCFIKYEDPRSCELAVDNLHGATIVGRKIKVSFANNTNAVKAKKPSIIAPQQGGGHFAGPDKKHTEVLEDKEEHRHEERDRERENLSSRDRDRNRDRDRDRDQDRDKDRDREKHRHKHKDRDTDREKYKDRDTDREKHKHKDRDLERRRNRDGDKKKHKHKDEDRKRHKHKHRDEDRKKHKHSHKSH